MASMALSFDILAKDNASRVFDKIGRSADTTGSKASKLGATFGKAAGVMSGALAGLAIGSFFKDAVGGASDLSETMSKTKNVFGPASAEIIKFSKTAATSFGLSQSAALAATSQFGDMFHQLGFTQQASSATSQSLVKMAADLGSFHNVDPTDVLQRIGGALRGEYDSLQQLIPNISAARVEHEALIETHKKSASALTAAEKATATLAIIQRDGANAANDFAETSDGLANKQRILSATFEDTKARIGAALLPAMTSLAGIVLNNVLPAVERLGGFLRDKLGPTFNFIKDALKVLKIAFGEDGTELGEFEGKLRIVNDAAWRVRAAFEAVATFMNTTVLPVVQKIAAFLGGQLRIAFDQVKSALADNREEFQQLATGLSKIAEIVGKYVVPAIVLMDGAFIRIFGAGLSLAIRQLGATIRLVELMVHTLERAISAAQRLSTAMKSVTGGGRRGGGLLGAVSPAAAALSFLPGRAAGGPVSTGSYLVGERGPEILHMRGSGHVTPNDQIGGNNYTINVPAIDTRDRHGAANAVLLALRMAT